MKKLQAWGSNILQMGLFALVQHMMKKVKNKMAEKKCSLVVMSSDQLRLIGPGRPRKN